MSLWSLLMFHNSRFDCCCFFFFFICLHASVGLWFSFYGAFFSVLYTFCFSLSFLVFNWKPTVIFYALAWKCKFCSTLAFWEVFNAQHRHTNTNRLSDSKSAHKQPMYEVRKTKTIKNLHCKFTWNSLSPPLPLAPVRNVCVCALISFFAIWMLWIESTLKVDLHALCVLEK